MGTLYEIVTALCVEAKVSPSKMCEDIKVSKSLITKLKNDAEKSISAKTAQKIADYFGVSVDRVLGNEETKKAAPENEDGVDIIRLIERLIEENGLTRERFCYMAGISTSTYAKWESGEAVPSVRKLVDASRVLGTTVEYLLTGDEELKDPFDNMSEEFLDRVLVQSLMELTPDEQEKVDSYAKGLIAARKD